MNQIETKNDIPTLVETALKFIPVFEHSHIVDNFNYKNKGIIRYEFPIDTYNKVLYANIERYFPNIYFDIIRNFTDADNIRTFCPGFILLESDENFKYSIKYRSFKDYNNFSSKQKPKEYDFSFMNKSIDIVKHLANRLWQDMNDVKCSMFNINLSLNFFPKGEVEIRHRNMLFISRKGDTIQIFIYEPEGKESGLRVLLLNFSQRLEEALREASKNNVTIVPYNKTCPVGLQDLRKRGGYNDFYCIMHSYLWLFCVLFVANRINISVEDINMVEIIMKDDKMYTDQTIVSFSYFMINNAMKKIFGLDEKIGHSILESSYNFLIEDMEKEKHNKFLEQNRDILKEVESVQTPQNQTTYKKAVKLQKRLAPY